MDFRQISYLITIAEKNCNVTKAAKSLFLSQAALSKALLAAEQELETQIFLRERGRLVGLSPAGKILIAQAKNLLSSYAEMREKIALFSKQMSGRVRIGIPMSILDVLLARQLSSVILGYPSVQFDLDEDPAIVLEKKFLSEELDILIRLSYQGSRSEGCEKDLLASQPFGAIMDLKHPLAQKTVLDWTDLKGYSLGLPPQSFSRMLITDRLKKASVYPPIAVSALSSKLLIYSVAGSEVVTVLPKIFYDAAVKDSDAIIWKPIAESVHWNVEILMQRCHREDQDLVAHIYDRIKGCLHMTPDRAFSPSTPTRHSSL